MAFFKELVDKIKAAVGLGPPPNTLSIREKFERFKNVLRCNQTALEIIADMGEKLSGDYIFDRHYIEATVEELSETVLRCVHALNALCENRYTHLYDVYEKIHDRLLKILSGREDREGPPILLLNEITKSYFSIVGGKALHLAKIINDLSLPVPQGFVITTRSYHDVIGFSELAPKVDRLEGLIASPVASAEEIERLRKEIRQAIYKVEPPPHLLGEIERAMSRLDLGDRDEMPFFAVRSSAQEEDMDFSFAGQFDSVLNVKAEPRAIFEAYKKVIASLFAKNVIEYRRTVLEGEGQMSIAALCQIMVDAKSSGVLYSTDPLNPATDDVVIVATWGQGEAVVDGKMPTDSFRVSKADGMKIVEKKVAKKEEGLYLSPKGGLEKRRIPPELQEKPCLTDEQVLSLARIGKKLESYFKHPQDVEWALDNQDNLLVLQSRALLVKEDTQVERDLSHLEEKYEVIATGGLTAQQGIGYGPVKIVKSIDDLDDVPEGSVLVSPRDMSLFVTVMKKVSAIVTEVGTPVSHMSTICRELCVPCLVNVTGILSKVKDGMEITVDAEDQKIYKGKVNELLIYHNSQCLNVFESSDFRLLRRVLGEVSRLNLVDPLIEEFRMDKCETYHDILRFIHEKAVNELIELGRDEKKLLQGNITKRLDLPIPAGILCIDLGGGISEDAPEDHCEFKHVTSIPFKALLHGMMTPGVWHTDVMEVSFRDMVTSMINAPTDALDGQYSGHNIAIITREYVNLSLRFGYHFNIVDAYCSDFPRDNHIYFRFLGGATDITKRSRRAKLIAEILRAYDLNVKTKGDVVTARMGNMPRQDMEYHLEILGRLIGFTRQLDVHMESDEVVELYRDAFLKGDYEIARR